MEIDFIIVIIKMAGVFKLPNVMCMCVCGGGGGGREWDEITYLLY